jgi:tRNA threonylcarbamoyladenosine biosynthesis protein TsaB
MPRQHQQQLFALLDELLGGRSLADLNLKAIAYGCGPGSFTGLRIAVSAAQGLAYSLGVPVVGISTLKTQALTLIRREGLSRPATILSTIDARIGQVYAQCFAFDGADLVDLGKTVVAEPEAINREILGLGGEQPFVAVGSGCALFNDGWPSAMIPLETWPDVLPEAEDMLKPAAQLLRAGTVHDPADAAPDYVQKRIGWKTLAEQGRKV